MQQLQRIPLSFGTRLRAVIGVSGLAAALAAATIVGPVAAQSQTPLSEHEEQIRLGRAFRGTVTATGDNTFTVQVVRGEQTIDVTVTLADDFPTLLPGVRGLARGQNQDDLPPQAQQGLARAQERAAARAARAEERATESEEQSNEEDDQARAANRGAQRVAALADVQVGDSVLVRAVQGTQDVVVSAQSTASVTAWGVRVLPANQDQRVVGTVTTNASATSLTVAPLDGGPNVTFTLDADTTFRPEGQTYAALTTGTRVTVVASEDGTTASVVRIHE